MVTETASRMQPCPSLNKVIWVKALCIALLAAAVFPLSCAMSGGFGSGGGSGDMELMSPFSEVPVSSSIADVSTPTPDLLMPESSSSLSGSSQSSISPIPSPSSLPSPSPSMLLTTSPSPQPSPVATLTPQASPSSSPLSTPKASTSIEATPFPSPLPIVSPSLEVSNFPEATPSFTSTSISPTPEVSIPSPEVFTSPEATPSSEVSTSPSISPTPEVSTSTPVPSPSPEVFISPSPSPEVSTFPSPSPEVSTSPKATPLPSPELPTDRTSPSPSNLPPTTPPPPTSVVDALLEELGIPGVVGAAVALVVILALLLILCCICCCCICKRVRKRDTRSSNLAGMGFEKTSHDGSNGVLGMKYQPQTSLLDLHLYGPGDAESAGFHYNETAIDDFDFPGQSQMLPSQLSLANTEIFQKSTLPELSPMAYSLTADYPFPYLDTLPASTLSLRQPTRFGLSLQEQEESAQGSRLSMHGSRPSVHGSRPSIHGSRPSIHESRPSIYSSRTSSMQGGLQGSHHLLYASGASGESLLSGGRYDKEHSIEDQEEGVAVGMTMDGDDLSLSIASPQLLSNAGSMEVPTRDSSPLPRPFSLLSATSHQLGHGRKDFASLTCIINPSIGSPSPEPQGEEPREVSPTHNISPARRDLTVLTSLASPSRTSNARQQNTIPEEDHSAKVKKKDESPSTKKDRFKNMSRLEKLTSLDYIRQSFRIKKKKVSFQKTPESTPTPSKRKSTAGSKDSAIIFANKLTEESPQRRVSTASSDMFSPTEESFLRAEQGHPQHGDQPMMGVAHGDHPMMDVAHGDHLMMGVAHGDHPTMGPRSMPIHGYAQLSQPSYYLPHQYAYPQLSQQYHPQLSQSYVPYPSPYHHMATTEPREPRDHRYQGVVTPDFSDITTPEHGRYRERPLHSPEPRQGSEFSYELRAHSPVDYTPGKSPQERSPDKFTESERYKPDHELMGEYGGHHLGIHPEHMRSPGHYGREPFPLGSPQRYSMGDYARNSMERDGYTRSNSLDQDRRFSGRTRSGGGETAGNSISVDDPHHHYSLSHHKHEEQRYSGVSESSNSESRFIDDPEGTSGKGRVSWSSEVTEYPAED